jgi:hypothetical protein
VVSYSQVVTFGSVASTVPRRAAYPAGAARKRWAASIPFACVRTVRDRVDREMHQRCGPDGGERVGASVVRIPWPDLHHRPRLSSVRTLYKICTCRFSILSTTSLRSSTSEPRWLVNTIVFPDAL